MLKIPYVASYVAFFLICIQLLIDIPCTVEMFQYSRFPFYLLLLFLALLGNQRNATWRIQESGRSNHDMTNKISIILQKTLTFCFLIVVSAVFFFFALRLSEQIVFPNPNTFRQPHFPEFPENRTTLRLYRKFWKFTSKVFSI